MTSLAPLELNAISKLVITNFPSSSSTVHLTRRNPAPLKGCYTIQPSILPNGPPERLASTLPPPGNFELTISLDEMIGDGRCGKVYTTSLLHLVDPSSSSLADIINPGLPYLPSLVIKVADQDRVDDLANEASVYDEMESLQGVVIPRCYGWFEVEVAGRAMRSNDGSLKISILLFERVGGHLPVGETLPDRDISRLGIHQPDMRYSNLLFAPNDSTDHPSSFPSLPSKPCPYHQRTHSYRIIDLDRARKTDWTLKQHYYEHVRTLGRLLESMESMGNVLEPWEY
ncbi:hypothetical protein D9613_011116 [Agrocybe pediades]|uniref:Uncharacterized protein n=1 Tax=Agrocybe pediades TaxID=84607 RepID=A0A8H4QL54_9AGAR|nr:hypothetical protein D9613_011116 [Agrocybe pediades]